MFRPFERFIHVQAASGIVLLAAAAIAVVWANSPWRNSYSALWQTRFAIALGGWSLEATLGYVVNDILMSVFFLVIGLEIRHELHTGALRTGRRAALPVAAAIGGMIVPITIYLVVGTHAARGGWAIPASTDTAFALGIFALMGTRIPAGLRILLLATAIIDDIGAVLLIAIFYSSGIELAGIALAVVGVGCVLLLQRFGVRRATAYAVPSIVVWSGLSWAGIHPSVAGLVVGLLTPARTWYGHQGFVAAAHAHLATIAQRASTGRARLHDLVKPMAALRRAQRESFSPAERIEAAVQTWAAFLVMPVFAFANAGVDFANVNTAAAPGVSLGIALGLVLGKLGGILAASLIAVKTRITELPDEITWRGMVVLAAVSGVGFTMALFIANLAFADDRELRDLATATVLWASACAAVLALVLGRLLLAPPAEQHELES